MITSEGISEVHIKSNAVGKGSVEVDGEDLSEKLVGYTVQCEKGQLPVVTLYPSPCIADITLDAQVVVAKIEDFEEWIDTIDPDVLAELAINTGKPTADGFKEAIKELWRGR